MVEKKYSEEDVEHALEEMNEGMSRSQAALKWNVPSSTLHRRKMGCSTREVSHANQQKLDAREEETLEYWVTQLCKTGYRITKDQLCDLAVYIRGQRPDDTKKPLTIGHKWVDLYLKRHPQVKALTQLTTDKDADRVQRKKEKYDRWFDAYKTHCIDAGIEPRNIYNMVELEISFATTPNRVNSRLDRTAMATGSRMSKTDQDGHQVVLDDSHPQSRQQSPGQQDELFRDISGLVKQKKLFVNVDKPAHAKVYLESVDTVIECFCQDGSTSCDASMFIRGNEPGMPDFIRNLGEEEPTAGEVWTSKSIVLAWLKYNWGPVSELRARGAKRALLIDGDALHHCGEFIAYCFENDIELLLIPARSTHALQPANFSLIKTLKDTMQSILNEIPKPMFQSQLNGHVSPQRYVDQMDIVQMYLQAREHTMIQGYILNAWEASGMHPFNPSKVLDKLKTFDGSQSLANRNGRGRGTLANQNGFHDDRLYEPQHTINEFSELVEVAIHAAVSEGTSSFMHNQAKIEEDRAQLEMQENPTTETVRVYNRSKEVQRKAFEALDSYIQKREAATKQLLTMFTSVVKELSETLTELRGRDISRLHASDISQSSYSLDSNIMPESELAGDTEPKRRRIEEESEIENKLLLAHAQMQDAELRP